MSKTRATKQNAEMRDAIRAVSPERFLIEQMLGHKAPVRDEVGRITGYAPPAELGQRIDIAKALLKKVMPDLSASAVDISSNGDSVMRLVLSDGLLPPGIEHQEQLNIDHGSEDAVLIDQGTSAAAHAAGSCTDDDPHPLQLREHGSSSVSPNSDNSDTGVVEETSPPPGRDDREPASEEGTALNRPHSGAGTKQPDQDTQPCPETSASPSTTPVSLRDGEADVTDNRDNPDDHNGRVVGTETSSAVPPFPHDEAADLDEKSAPGSNTSGADTSTPDTDAAPENSRSQADDGIPAHERTRKRRKKLSQPRTAPDTADIAKSFRRNTKRAKTDG